MNNKIVYLALVIAAVALIISLMSKQNIVSEKDTLGIIQSTGKVNVCYGIYPPSAMIDSQTQELKGFDIETIQGLFSQINVNPVFIEQSWGNMITALQSGRCDISLAMIAQISRATAVSFSEPMYYLGQGVAGRSDENRFQTIEDLDKKGIKIAVANGESGHNFAKANLKNAELIVISIEGSDLSRIFSEVTSGRADVVITDAGTVKKYVETHPQTKSLFNNKPIGLSPVGMVVRKEDKNLLQFLNTSIDILKSDGTIQDLQRKYNAGFINEVNTYEVIK